MPRSLKKQRKPSTTFPSPWPQTTPLTPSLWPRTTSSCSRRCDFLLLYQELHELSFETKSYKRWPKDATKPMSVETRALKFLPSKARMRRWILFCTLAKHTLAQKCLLASRRRLPACETRCGRPHSIIRALALILAWLRYACPSSHRGNDLNFWSAVIN